MEVSVLYLPSIPQCQFCDNEAKYEAISTDPKTLHDWVYVCQNDLGAKTISDLGVGTGRLVQQAE